jgi:hypothetical protein
MAERAAQAADPGGGVAAGVAEARGAKATLTEARSTTAGGKRNGETK